MQLKAVVRFLDETLDRNLWERLRVKQDEKLNPAAVGNTPALMKTLDELSDEGSQRVTEGGVFPQVEAEYQELSRDLENVQKLYEETQEKQRQAELSLALEQSESGERLVLAQRPSVPTAPAWPPRVPIFILGFILAISMGVGIATMREVTSTTVRSSRDALELCGMPPIALIPPIYNSARRVAKGFKDTAFLVCTLAIGLIAYTGATVL